MDDERWRRLCAQAVTEPDSEKLWALAREINSLLEQREAEQREAEMRGRTKVAVPKGARAATLSAHE